VQCILFISNPVTGEAMEFLSASFSRAVRRAWALTGLPSAATWGDWNLSVVSVGSARTWSDLRALVR
jgi:hypothetical protein